MSSSVRGRWEIGIAVSGFAWVLSACEGRLASAGDRDGSLGLDASLASPDVGSLPDPDAPGSPDAPRATDAASPPPFDAGPCPSGSLAERIVSRSLGIAAFRAPFLAASRDGGAFVAFSDGSAVGIQRLAGDGTPFGPRIPVSGSEVWGFDASDDVLGVVVARGADALYFEGVAYDGTMRFSHRLLGEVPHDVVGNEWFGRLIRYGRLRFTGREWAAYYTVNRLWPDGIAHYGDQLRTFRPDGSPEFTLWDWGCSHSMEVRIEHNGTRLAPVCASDCYPSKGIHFDHRGGRIYPDEGLSNCAGGYGTSLGGVVPMPDGFWVTFTATDMRESHDVAMVRVGNDGSIGAPTWLTNDGARDANVHAARYGAGFVVAWDSGDGTRFARFDAAGTMVEGPALVAGIDLGSASDFVVLANGDVGWASAPSGELTFTRLRTCE